MCLYSQHACQSIRLGDYDARPRDVSAAYTRRDHRASTPRRRCAESNIELHPDVIDDDGPRATTGGKESVHEKERSGI